LIRIKEICILFRQEEEEEEEEKRILYKESNHG
jgi:hypothetical protein